MKFVVYSDFLQTDGKSFAIKVSFPDAAYFFFSIVFWRREFYISIEKE